MKYENVNVAQILDEEGIQYHENRKHLIVHTCPTCGKTDKLYVDKKKKIWICYACVGPEDAKKADTGKGNLYGLLLAFGWDKERIRQKLNGRDVRPSGDLIPETIQAPKIEPVKDERHFVTFDLPQRYVRLDRSPQQMGLYQAAYMYLWGRHFKTIEQYLRFKPMFDPKAMRVVFPCRTLDGTTVGYQARDITDRHKHKHPRCPNYECELKWVMYFKGEKSAPENCPACGTELKTFMYPKSLNNSDLPKSDFFFGEDSINWFLPVVLVEGPFDATNVRNGIALLGKSLAENQLKLLIDNAKEIIIYFDGDEAGTMAAASVYEQLRPFINIKMVATPKGSDPGECSLEKNDERIKNALDPISWHMKNNLVAL